MPKKTTILIAILAVITVGLLFLAVTSGQKSGTLQTPPIATPTRKPVVKTTKVYFNPETLNVTANTPTTVDIMVNTNGSDISGVQVEAQYDPKALSNVRITPSTDSSSFFGSNGIVLLNDTVPATGRISLAIAINAGDPVRHGMGKVATLTFQKAVGNVLPTTAISFLDKTLVTQLGENQSVLESATPLSITFSQNSVPTTQTNTIPPANTTPTQ